jgi:hypothetical protein
MPCPAHIAKIFYDQLIGCPSPSDRGAEQRVLGAILAGGGDAMALAVGYLVDEDFTDTTARETFQQQVAGFKAAGGVPAAIANGSPLVADMRTLRRHHARRIVEKMGWELAYSACKTDDPLAWCKSALDRIQKAAGRMNDSGIGGESDDAK